MSNASENAAQVKSVVLVHGGFVDGSGWEGVYRLLKKDGYEVIVAQNPTTSLADDVAVTKRAIASAAGDVILVGHSYGGAVITESGTDPKVAGLVYITAFAPDRGESVATLIANPQPGDPVPRSFRLSTASFSWIGRNSLPPSQQMFSLISPHSWAIPRCRGVWPRSRARSLNRPGG